MRAQAGTVVRVATIVVLLAGVVSQFVQGTDPTFPLLYFTVCSAIFLAVTLMVAQVRTRSPAIDQFRGAATAAVVLSGLIFATVLAPVNNGGSWFAPHDDGWVRAANVLLHGVGPVLALIDLALHGLRLEGRPWRTAMGWCLWPVAWACVVLPLDLLRVADVPYEFLRIRVAADVPLVLGAMVGLFGLVTLIGRGLLVLARRTASGGNAKP